MQNHDDDELDILDILRPGDLAEADRVARQEKINLWVVRRIRRLETWNRAVLLAASIIAALVGIVSAIVAAVCSLRGTP